MKADMRHIVKFIRKHDRFLLTAHARSDGDALGSLLALQSVLRKMGKKARAVSDGGAMPEYAFLPGASRVGSGPEQARPPYDAVIVLDCGDWERLERIAGAIDRAAQPVANVDHHSSNTRFGDVNWVDAKSASCGEMILKLADALGVAPDRSMALCLYTAIVTDSGRFCFSNTRPETHRMTARLLELGVRPHRVHQHLYRGKTRKQVAFLSQVLGRIRFAGGGKVGWVTLDRALFKKAGYEPTETQDYIDAVRSVEGVRTAILFRELKDGRVKVSFRTTEGIDGAKLAGLWGGGGHPRASGASMQRRPLGDIEREVVRKTLRFMERRS